MASTPYPTAYRESMDLARRWPVSRVSEAISASLTTRLCRTARKPNRNATENTMTATLRQQAEGANSLEDLRDQLDTGTLEETFETQGAWHAIPKFGRDMDQGTICDFGDDAVVSWDDARVLVLTRSSKLVIRQRPDAA